jgi:hypothetical protein
MKRVIPFVMLLAIACLCAPAAQAKGKKDKQTSTGTYGVARFDVNENGAFEPSEFEALRKAFQEGDTALKALDTNNDGKLDDSEMAAIKPPAAKDQKKKKKKDA